MGNIVSRKEKRQLGPGWWKPVQVFNAPGEPEPDGSLVRTATATLAEELERLMRPIVDEYVHENLVDYDGIKASSAYAAYRRFATTTLRRAALEKGAEDKVARAFFVNLYNMLTIDAICQAGSPSDLNGRLLRWSTASYSIGGLIYSLNDIENGILRGNQKSAVPGTRITIPKKDGKIAYVLPLDRRIHFALNCGAISCPPVRVFSGAGHDAELDAAARDYLARYLRVLPETRKVKLTRLALWFAGDFGGAKNNILRNVQPFAQGETATQLGELLAGVETVEVEHFPYSMDPNWTTMTDNADKVEQERVDFWEAV